MIKNKKILLSFSALLLSIMLMAQDVTVIKDMIDNERYNSAENLVTRKINEKGVDPELNYLLVKIYLEQDKEEAAKNFIEQYHLGSIDADASPVNSIAYGRYLLGIGDKSGALSVFEQVLDKKNKKDPSMLMAIAEAHINEEKGDAMLAIELLDMAAKRDKKNAEIDILKGNAYRKLSDASKAYLSFQKALDKDPDNVKALYLLGRIFVSQKNADVYMENFNKAYSSDSTYAPVLEALYNHYYFRDVRKAKTYLEKFIANSDYSRLNDYRLTDLLYLNKNYKEAIALAKDIIAKDGEEAQPRLYKLIAYSLEATGDSASALNSINDYFAKEATSKIIAPDYELRARLTARVPGEEEEAISYYSQAHKLDSLVDNKLKYSIEIAALYKELKNYKGQSRWLGRVYEEKTEPSNVDLFNWGIAHYNAGEYDLSDSIFSRYTSKYPESIFGYYWRANANAAIDTSFSIGLAIPFYEKAIELGEKNIEANKSMLIKSYAYLGGYEANEKKDYAKSLVWFEKILMADPGNSNATKYIEILKNWIEEGK